MKSSNRLTFIFLLNFELSNKINSLGNQYKVELFKLIFMLTLAGSPIPA